MSETVSDTELVERFPWVVLSHDSKHHFRGWLDKRLLINRCSDCSAFHHPPKPICHVCWSENLVPTEVEGTGTVHLAMHLHQGAPAPDVDYAKGPHPVVTVDLDGTDGVRFSSTVVDLPVEEVVIGLPVKLDWIERYGQPFPVFRKREA
ncbi:MAG: zinc ribbon domain-containing protein [Myxococcota bacterium]